MGQHRMGLLIGSLLPLAACQPPADTTLFTPTPQSTAPQTLLTYAIALDEGFPFDPTLVDDAVAAGLERWLAPDIALRLHGQGRSDHGVIADDGLQTIWIWWYSEPFPADEQAWMAQVMHKRPQEGIGFDLVIQGPRCPGLGHESEAEIFNALSNAVAQGMGLALGLPTFSDGDGILGQTQCRSDIALFPSEREVDALRFLYPAD